MPIQAITFDVGETLVTPAISRAEAFVQATRALGLDQGLSIAQVEPLIPHMNAYLASLVAADPSFDADEVRAQSVNYRKYEYLCDLLSIQTNKRMIAREVQGIYQLPSAWKLLPGADETLSGLRQQGYQLAIISNWTENLPSILEGLGIAGVFDEITVSSSVGLYKPQLEIFLRTARSLGRQPAECLHIGDNIVADVEGATKAGFSAVLFDLGRKSSHAGIPSIASLLDLLPYLEQRQA